MSFRNYSGPVLGIQPPIEFSFCFYRISDKVSFFSAILSPGKCPFNGISSIQFAASGPFAMDYAFMPGYGSQLSVESSIISAHSFIPYGY